MDAEEFRRRGKEMIDFVADYMENVRDRPVYPPPSEITPGYLPPLLASEAPQEPESFEAIMQDVNRVVLPGVTEWHSPRFHAYYPTANSYPAIIADILSDAIGCIGFTWASSPSCTELETVMMDWLGKMLQLPEHFLFSSKGKGGGIIHGTASEATLTALLAARSRTVAYHMKKNPELTPGAIVDKLVGFCSDQAHSSVERAFLLGGIPNVVQVKSDENNSMRGDALKAEIAAATAKGMIPFYVVCTLGTTSTCAFDNLKEIGPVVAEYNEGDSKSLIWLHVDAAYAGSAFICPEFRPLLDGVEFVDSFNFNPHKWLLVNFDCSAMWFRDSSDIVHAFNVDPVYLKHPHQGIVPDYRHWQIPLGRRFRSLKLFFVLRLYGVKQLQEHIRRQVAQAHLFEQLVLSDDRFEITEKVILGLVCFRLKSTGDLKHCNEVNQQLVKNINGDNRIHLTPTEVKGQYILRFAVCGTRTTDDDIKYSWSVIQELADKKKPMAS